jgi:hypothetical protein
MSRKSASETQTTPLEMVKEKLKALIDELEAGLKKTLGDDGVHTVTRSMLEKAPNLRLPGIHSSQRQIIFVLSAFAHARSISLNEPNTKRLQIMATLADSYLQELTESQRQSVEKLSEQLKTIATNPSISKELQFDHDNITKLLRYYYAVVTLCTEKAPVVNPAPANAANIDAGIAAFIKHDYETAFRYLFVSVIDEKHNAKKFLPVTPTLVKTLVGQVDGFENSFAFGKYFFDKKQFAQSYAIFAEIPPTPNGQVDLLNPVRIQYYYAQFHMGVICFRSSGGTQLPLLREAQAHFDIVLKSTDARLTTLAQQHRQEIQRKIDLFMPAKPPSLTS